MRQARRLRVTSGQSVSRHIKIGDWSGVWEARLGGQSPHGQVFSRVVEQEGSRLDRTRSRLVAEQAAVFPRSAAAGSNVAAGRRGSAAAGFNIAAGRSGGAAAGGTGRGAAGGTGRASGGTSGSTAARRHMASMRSRGAAAGSNVAALRRRRAAGGLFLATVEQTGFSVNSAKATNHHGSGQSDPFHISASPRKVWRGEHPESNRSQLGGRGHPGNSVFGFLRSDGKVINTANVFDIRWGNR